MSPRCLAIIALSIGLGACSACQLPDSGNVAFHAAYWKPYDAGKDKVAATASSVIQRNGPDVTGSITTSTDEETSRRARLFSSAEDHKPWPNMNSPEWLAQQELDDREEKKVEREMRICNGC